MLQLRTATVTGRDHLARRANCQDALAAWQAGESAVAVVCDGCGGGAYSEVGARLAAHYLTAQAVQLLSDSHQPDEIPNKLYTALTSYLETLINISTPPDKPNFVLNHLLFTVVGTIINPAGGVIFTAGDGLYAVDDKLAHIDQHNHPAYPAYDLVPESLPADFTAMGRFTSQTIPPNWSRIAIATDGFEPDLLPNTWDHPHPRGLQRQMNIWSDKDHRFRDDATLITIQKIQDATP